ncbi:MAG TPA: gamma-glutamyl-gamma-aminobutyrate hydrolase family protein [Terracidiphilus sp.]|nr:gamma-glutamyl-gamma-aminobutyrate hydrolase family protein [Terracidiphilus sp.]
MTVRIAIPEPTSRDDAYNERALPQYMEALEAAGAKAIIVPLDARPDRVARLLQGTQGVLLPGSRYDVDPERYGEERIPACGEADPARTAADELLLQDAFNLRKPILAICQGIQSLNVWRGGTLIQDLAGSGKTAVNHAPGRTVNEAHAVELSVESRLSGMVSPGPGPVMVNSSHHQALKVVGDNLRVTAVSPVDKVVEAVELDAPDHFVVGVQWHPERTYTVSALSRALFESLVRESEAWGRKHAGEPAADL